MQSDPQEENHKEYLALMDEVVDKQDAFIREILDFFRAKRSSVSCKPFSLHALIEDVIKVNSYSQLAQNLVIKKELKTDEVNTDELRVKMIINNLLSNAIKYSDQRKKQRVINISADTVEDNVLIAVEDNGIGISEEQKGRIFDLFYTGNKSSRDSSGLGLYILRQNVEKLRGRIELESEPGIGSKFRVYIPTS
jgi:signal transduction histidine kinase